MNDYYFENYNDWLFLTNIDIETALKLIKKKEEVEIKKIINLSYKDIENLLIKYSINFDDYLSCEIKESTKLTEREEEFLTLMQKGYSIKEISSKLICSQNVVKTKIKIFIAKILIGLYPNLKEIV